MAISKVEGAALVASKGWLSLQPEAFRLDVIDRSHMLHFMPGEPVYRIGDPPGGIYGLVRGSLGISLAPPENAPRFVQFGIAGRWAGEGPFLTGEQRRVEMRAVTPCDLLHLPLDAMNQMAARNPEAIRYFARITVGHFDILVRLIDDLLIAKADRRIAAVLNRAGWLQEQPIPISQTELGGMANASRKQVNAALATFAEKGWISHSYRSVEVHDREALLKFAREEA